MISACAVFVGLMFTIVVRWLYQGGKLQQLQWDMATITAGDYTVEFPIKEYSYKKWYQEHFLNQVDAHKKSTALSLS